MLHVCYATAFRFDAYLGDFLFFSFFKTFHSVCLGLMFRLGFRGYGLGLALL